MTKQASRNELVARIEHDAEVIARLVVQRDTALRELAEANRRHTELLLAAYADGFAAANDQRASPSS